MYLILRTPRLTASRFLVIKDEACSRVNYFDVQQRARHHQGALEQRASAANAAVNTVYKLTHRRPLATGQRGVHSEQLRHREGFDLQLSDPRTVRILNRPGRAAHDFSKENRRDRTNSRKKSLVTICCRNNSFNRETSYTSLIIEMRMAFDGAKHAMEFAASIPPLLG